jgi:ABC-2 type transport system permease protein
MKPQGRDWRMDARVIGAIFTKDLREVMRNKNTIMVLISALFIVALYRGLPGFAGGRDPLRVWVSDEGQSTLAAYLENSPVIDAWTGAQSLDKVKELVRESETPEIGLVIPADFDRRLQASEPVALQGYLMDWLSPEQAARTRQVVEDEITRLVGRRVPIETERNVLSLLPDSGGLGVQASLAAVFMLTMVGASLVPHLMMAEKQEHTLDVLLTSPANEMHVVLGKALVGMVYCVIGGAFALAVNHAIVAHWWLAILGVVCYSLLSVGLGLALGVKIETRAQLSLWSWVIFIPLFLPTIAVLLEGLVPQPVVDVLRFVPSVMFCTAWRYAFAPSISPLVPLAWLGGLLLWAGAVLAVIVLWTRQRDSAGDRRAQRLAPAHDLHRPGVQAPGSAQPSGVLSPVAAPPVGAGVTLLGRVERAPRSSSRIVGAIYAKDMREAISNKLLLSILIGTALVILNGLALPFLVDLQWKPTALVYDQGHSTLIRGLAGEEDFRIRLVDDQAEFDEVLTAGPSTYLGLVLPADFDQRAGDPAGISLEGYFANWASADRLEETSAAFQEQLTLAAWTPVHVDLEGHVVYPEANVGGQISINLATLVIAATAIGAAMVPLLMVEEKQAHTLEALLASPARFVEVVVGKALVGATYCFVAMLVASLFNARYIVHWPIVLLASSLSAAFVVSLGMLVGTLTDNPTSAAMWGTPIILLTMISTLGLFFAGDTLHPLVSSLLQWSPGSVMVNLYRLSEVGSVPTGLLWSNAAALAGMAAAVYLLVAWRIRRLVQ